MRIYCDFDGTISTLDTTDHVLSRLADPAWAEIEADWLAGRINAARCMREQVALIGGDDAQLDAVLDTVEVDEGFVAFVGWCRSQAIPVTVVSDGVDYFIRRILGRHGLDDLPIISNRLAGVPGGRRLQQPWMRTGCAAGSGVCKCEIVAPPGGAAGDGPVVFVGDGRSDFCVSARADILFAKDGLATYARGRGQPFHPYQTFNDVMATLSALRAPARVAV